MPSTLIHFMTVLYTRWLFDDYTQDQQPNDTYQKFCLKKNSVKVCWHLSYLAQNSFHFDEIFHRKFKIPILVCVVCTKTQHLVPTLGTIFGTKIDLPL